MKKSLALIFGLVIALMLAPAANAATPSVSELFQSEDTPLACAQDGAYTYCGSNNKNTATTVPSFDGTPIDTVVGLPTSSALNVGGAGLPVIGYFHGWGGNKVDLKNDAVAQALLGAGFAVISVTDRGWGNSCGGPSVPLGASVKTAPCAKGYIHLMSNAYEVRDAQTIIGKLADDVDDSDAPIINPIKVGATGGSYGGAISEALAMLRNRVQMTDGSYDAWESPDGKTMAIAGATPQYTWSDLAASLAPNGSTLDYAIDNPYQGPNDDRRTGVTKQQWVFNLYASGLQAGYYSPSPPHPAADPTSNIFYWNSLLNTGGPYDGNSAVESMLEEITTNHSSYYIPIDNASQKPAPMLISGSWNDDLFPFNEALRLYNKVQADAPSVDVSVWGIDIGHTPRANNDSASRAADAAALVQTQVEFFIRHLVNPAYPYTLTQFKEHGGAVATSSKCGTGASNQKRVAGTLSFADNWAEFTTKGEVDINGDDSQTIEPNTSPNSPFQTGTTTGIDGSGTDVCDYDQRTDDTEGAAVYKSDPAGGSGYTIIGSPSVTATFDVKGANDQIVSRLYDYDPSGVGHQRLIARGVYRPTGVGAGPTTQTFQLFPQNYTVEAGHTLKLELLSADMPFAQISKNTHQQPIEVSNLKLQVPVNNTPGDADGQVVAVSPRTLPAGYEMTDDYLDTDSIAPSTTDNVPNTLQKSVTVTLDATDEGISGVDKTYYTIGASPATPTTSSTVYNPAAKPTLQDGEKISYFSVDRKGNAETVKTSVAAQVDSIAPDMPQLLTGPKNESVDTSASITFSIPTGIGEHNLCALDGGTAGVCTSPWTLSNLSVGNHVAKVVAIDSVGNVSAPLEVHWTTLGKISTSVKISGTVKTGKTITAKPTSKSGSSTLSDVKYTYQWYAGGTKISKKNKIKLSSKWKGRKIYVKVTATKSGYASSTVSKTATSKLK
ncbi:MAG: CocE/NonD family hydrolase C-terminal non-catalytic domain-containing protein [Solirubrobacterales bacterium]